MITRRGSARAPLMEGTAVLNTADRVVTLLDGEAFTLTPMQEASPMTSHSGFDAADDRIHQDEIGAERASFAAEAAQELAAERGGDPSHESEGRPHA